ncbi:MAG: PaaI family thioesterase [Synergistaceae bacterium]|nr:PaaI family thioesterase [Synergistaceae bacterium]MBQ7068505.1 PaaI family thioesterase [Synergistaceae bacterium]MBR0075166.1 PaaI family thioesterase [Synergistaceae bacterium]MBR0080196.1 PaaI family thioesterase [Synergistaceae bacterium]MBR0254232.1 PaaI family thioesterase [Synergistaceae bacterium]
MAENNEIKINYEALNKLKNDIEHKTGFRFIKIEDGIAVSELNLSEEHFNPYGIPYGGVLFTMADDTAGIAFLSAGGNGVTVNGHVDYLRGSRDAQKLICTAKVRKAGRRIFYIDADIVNEKDLDLCRFKFVFINLDS